MRKLFIILFLLIFLLFPAIPVQSATMVSGRPCPGGVAATCTTSNDSELVAIGGNASNLSIYTYYVAQPFTVTANTRVTEYSVYLRDTTATGNTTTCGIYTNASGAPGTLVEGTEDTDTFSTNSWTYVTFDVSGDSVLLSGTVYYVKCHAASASMLWGMNSTATGSNACKDEDNVSWACVDDYTHGLKINGCTP
jgi:hypothetical protein